MNWDKSCHWTNISENLSERSCISCGKETERYHKLFPNASKVVFTIVCLI